MRLRSVNEALTTLVGLLVIASGLSVGCSDGKSDPDGVPLIVSPDSGTGGDRGEVAAMGGRGFGGAGGEPGLSCENDEDCGDRQFCETNGAAPRCACLPGFSGQRCEDLDECAASPCGLHAQCENTFGGYVCTCDSGWTSKNGVCEDENECEKDLAVCGLNAVCKNEDGDYACGCPDGFYGDGRVCKTTPACNLERCGAQGECLETGSNFRCLCAPGDAGTIDCSSLCATVELAPALDQRVREILGKPVGTLNAEDVTAIEELTLQNAGLSDLSELECLTHLRHLDLSHNSIEAMDLAHVQALPELTNLRLDCNPTTSLALLAEHPSLREISLGTGGPNCSSVLENLEGLASIPKLASLRLPGHQLKSLAPLLAATGLRKLLLSDNALDGEDLGSLGALPLLETLDVARNALSDLAFVEKLSALDTLDVSGNALHTLDDLNKSDRLARFSAADCALSDAGAVTGLSSLVDLDLARNQLSNVDFVASLKKLAWLDLWGNNLLSLAPLLSLPSSGTLFIGDNPELCANPSVEKSSSTLRALEKRGWLVVDGCTPVP